MHDRRYITMIVVAKIAVEWGFQMIAPIAERFFAEIVAIWHFDDVL